MRIEAAQQHRESIGMHERRNKALFSDRDIQVSNDKISECIRNKTVDNVNAKSLFITGMILSAIILPCVKNVTNSQTNMHRLKRNEGHEDDNRTRLDRMKGDISRLRNVSEPGGYEKADYVTLHLSAQRLQPVKDMEYRAAHSIGQSLYSMVAAGADALSRFHRYRFPGAEGYVVPVVTTPRASTDAVERVSLDFVCLQERDDLSVGNVLKKIAETLQNPVSEMTKELTIVSYYNENHACPDRSDMGLIDDITKKVDEVINVIIKSYPAFRLVYLLKLIVAPILEIIADYLNGEKINQETIGSLHDELLGFFKMMIDFSLKRSDGIPVIDRKSVPKGLLHSPEGFFIKWRGENWKLKLQDDKHYAERNGVIHRVVYHQDENAWRAIDDQIADHRARGEDHFFTMCRTRVKRGNQLGKFCGVSFSENQRNREYSRFLFSEVHQELIEKLDMGLDEDSPDLEKLTFQNSWVVYRVTTYQRGLRKFYHAIEMNGKFVPVKSRKISENHVHCEIYNKVNPDESYPVVFHQGGWVFEAPTSPFVAENLQQTVTESMLQTTLTRRELSTPDHRGIKYDRVGNQYLQINGGAVKIIRDGNEYYLMSSEGDRICFSFMQGKYRFTAAMRENGKLKLTSEQLVNDRLMNSPSGLNVQNNIQLNDNWQLLKMNIQAASLNDVTAIGSKIDVTFRLKYEQNTNMGFMDLPRLYWREKIKVQEGESAWMFIANMFEHKQYSSTFDSWRYRYTEAYNYAKAQHKNTHNGLVKLLNNHGYPVKYHELETAVSDHEKVQAVKKYLQRKGGELEITLVDMPKVKKGINPINKERIVNFDIGFDDVGVVTFSQGISVVENNPEHVFVTTSDNIELARELINSAPPAHVAEKKIKRRKKR